MAATSRFHHPGNLTASVHKEKAAEPEALRSLAEVTGARVSIGDGRAAF